MNSIALTLTSLCAFLTSELEQPCTIEDAALFSIMIVESTGKDVKFHPDGKSYGYFGITKIACKDIDETFPPKRICEISTARKYLRKMVSRHCPDKVGEDALYNACGWYHGGDFKRRTAYIKKILSIDLSAYSEEKLRGMVALFEIMKINERK